MERALQPDPPLHIRCPLLHYAALTYAWADNVAHNDVVADVQEVLHRQIASELTRRNLLPGARDGVSVFRDDTNLSANGGLTDSLVHAFENSHYLVACIGRAYLHSNYCPLELAAFRKRFEDDRCAAIQHLFVLVLDEEATSQHWGEWLETPERPIHLELFDQNGPITATFEVNGRGRYTPRFINIIRRIAMAIVDGIENDAEWRVDA